MIPIHLSVATAVFGDRSGGRIARRISSVPSLILNSSREPGDDRAACLLSRARPAAFPMRDRAHRGAARLRLAASICVDLRGASHPSDDRAADAVAEPIRLCSAGSLSRSDPRGRVSFRRQRCLCRRFRWRLVCADRLVSALGAPTGAFLPISLSFLWRRLRQRWSYRRLPFRRFPPRPIVSRSV